MNVVDNNANSHCPDLIISSSDITFSNPSPNTGDDVTISAVVHNNGHTDVENARVSFYENEIIIGKDLVDDWDKIERVTDFFGGDFVPYVIYIDTTNEEDNVLTPRIIREMYNVSWAVSQLEDVRGSISIADYINTLCKYVINITDDLVFEDWYNLRRSDFTGSGYYITDKDIQLYLDLLLGTSSPSFDESIMKTLAPVFYLMENLSLTFDLILSEDFTEDNAKAQGAFMIIQMNDTLSRAEIADLVDSIHDKIDNVDTYSIKLRTTKLVRKGEEKLIGHEYINVPGNGATTASVKWNVPDEENHYMVKVRIDKCNELENTTENTASVIVHVDDGDVIDIVIGMIIIFTILLTIILLIKIFKR